VVSHIDVIVIMDQSLRVMWMTFWFVGTLLLRLWVVLRRPMMYLSSDWLPYVKRDAFHVLGFLCFLNFKK
jgi:hypothetical protein